MVSLYAPERHTSLTGAPQAPWECPIFDSLNLTCFWTDLCQIWHGLRFNGWLFCKLSLAPYSSHTAFWYWANIGPMLAGTSGQYCFPRSDQSQSANRPDVGEMLDTNLYPMLADAHPRLAQCCQASDECWANVASQCSPKIAPMLPDNCPMLGQCCFPMFPDIAPMLDVCSSPILDLRLDCSIALPGVCIANTIDGAKALFIKLLS